MKGTKDKMLATNLANIISFINVINGIQSLVCNSIPFFTLQKMKIGHSAADICTDDMYLLNYKCNK